MTARSCRNDRIISPQRPHNSIAMTARSCHNDRIISLQRPHNSAGRLFRCGRITVAFKVFAEENPLIIDRIVPVVYVMGTRTYDKIVTDTSLEEFLMEFPVDFQKEIFRSAVDDQGEISILDAVQLVMTVWASQRLWFSASLPRWLLIPQLWGNGRMSTPPLVLPAAPNRSL